MTKSIGQWNSIVLSFADLDAYINQSKFTNKTYAKRAKEELVAMTKSISQMYGEGGSVTLPPTDGTSAKLNRLIGIAERIKRASGPAIGMSREAFPSSTNFVDRWRKIYELADELSHNISAILNQRRS